MLSKYYVGSHKLGIDYVKTFAKANGFKLLTTSYINNSQVLKFKCSNGHITKMPFKIFNNYVQRNLRICKQCIKDERLTLAQELFKKRGYTLLSIEYKYNKAPLEYVCPNGHKGKIGFDSFQRGRGCLECGGRKKHSIDYIRDYFEKNGCQLLSTNYVNGRTKLNYICKCGRPHKATFNDFRAGCRCRECKREALTADNHYLYNPDLPLAVRLRNKLRGGDVKYKKWREVVIDRDGCCVACGSTHKLEAHHNFPINYYPEFRLKRRNGTTLCKTCHVEYHSSYGLKDIDASTLQVFIWSKNEIITLLVA